MAKTLHKMTYPEAVAAEACGAATDDLLDLRCIIRDLPYEFLEENPILLTFDKVVQRRLDTFLDSLVTVNTTSPLAALGMTKFLTLHMTRRHNLP